MRHRIFIIPEKIKEHKDDLFVVACVLLTGLLGFGLGRLSAPGRVRAPVTITQASTTPRVAPLPADQPRGAALLYVASKTGKKYHFPWCPGALGISEKNKLTFATKSEAEKAGYTPASNCKGL